MKLLSRTALAITSLLFCWSCADKANTIIFVNDSGALVTKIGTTLYTPKIKEEEVINQLHTPLQPGETYELRGLGIGEYIVVATCEFEAEIEPYNGEWDSIDRGGLRQSDGSVVPLNEVMWRSNAKDSAPIPRAPALSEKVDPNKATKIIRTVSKRQSISAGGSTITWSFP